VVLDNQDRALHPQQIHCVVQVAIILNFRYPAAIANWDSKEVDKLEKRWMRAFKEAWKVNASLPRDILGGENWEHQRLEPSSPVRPSVV